MSQVNLRLISLFFLPSISISFTQGRSPRALGSCSLLRVCRCAATNSQVRSQISAVVCGTPPLMSRSDNQDPFLSHTHFVTGEIPSSLGKLEKLERLYLDNNALSGKASVFGTSPAMSHVPCTLSNFHLYSFTQGLSPRALDSCSLLQICGYTTTNFQVR
jgi:hypothetical protein